jgi:hypothetical protein
MHKLIVHFTQRTQYMQYSTGNSYYLIAEVMYFPLHFCNAGVHCLIHRFPAHASFLPVPVMCVLDVPNFRGRLICTYMSSFVSSFVHTFFPGMFCSTALNYTVFPGLVHVAAESKCGASLHRNSKCFQASCPLVNRDLGESKVITGKRAPLRRNREGLARFLLSRVTLPLAHKIITASQSMPNI